MLFARKRQEGLSTTSPVRTSSTDGRRGADDRRTVRGALPQSGRSPDQDATVPLPPDDLSGIDYVYRQFHRFGRPSTTLEHERRIRPGSTTYRPDDETGRRWRNAPYLANDPLFNVMKELESKIW